MSHHVSDVETWGGPDRNYYVFVVLSVLLGFLGADHFYLRSFGTGTQKFIFNCCTLGMWYLWDLIQIWKNGPEIRTDGLASPFDWIRGIGRGVFAPLPTEHMAGGGGGGEAPKSYLLYAFLAVCFGWLGADKFYIGETWQGLAKLLSVFNIFLFLFGWLWVVWDAFHAFFMTKSIMKTGITAPMPYSFIWSDPISPDIFKVGGSPTSQETSGGLFAWLKTVCPPSFSLPFGELYKDVVAPLMTPPVVEALHAVSALPVTAPSMRGLTPPSVPLPLTPPSLPTIPSMITSPSVTSAPVRQEGGGGSGSGPGPVIAGTLTALVFAGGLKGFIDFVSKQRG